MPTSSITSDWSASFSTSSSESLEITSAEREEDSVSNVEPGSDVSGGDTQHACSIIVIALKAHEKLRLEPFVHALQNLVEEKNCKLVVICCMSRIQSEIGVDLLLDENAFRGVSKKKMDGAISTQRKIVLNFLEPIIAGLQKREIQIELQVAVGSRCDDILVKAAKELRPHWVVLDLSFSGRHLKKLHKVLECNLVLMKKKGSKPVILPCSPKCSGPASHPHDRVSVEVANPSSERSRSPCPRSDSSSEQITPAVVTTTSGTTSPARAHDTRDTDTSNTDSETETRPLAAIPTPLPTQVVATQTPSSPIHPGRLIGNPPLPTQVVATQSPSSPIHPGRLIGNPPAPSPTEFATSSPGRTVMGRRPAHAHAPDPSPVATQTPDRGYGRHLASSPPKFARQLGQTFGRHPAQGPALSQVGTQNPGRVLGLGAPSPTQDVTHRLRAQVPPARLSPAPVALTPSLQASMWPGPASRFSLPFIPPAPPDSTGNSATRSQAATRPTPPSCRTSTVGGQNRTEEIPYEIALAMAIKASILSASEEGVPVPQSALQQGSLGDEYNGDSGRERSRPSDGSVLVDLVPPTGPTSSSRDEDRRPSAEPSQRPIEGDFWGQLESDQRFHNYWALPPAPPSVIRARTSRPGSRLGQLPIGDNPRRLESSGSGSAVSSSAQSSTRGTSPFAPSASVESRSPYPSVDTSPIELVTDESTVGSSERPPRELQKDINSRKGGECAVCWDAQANAVCVPCGHVAGCMDCLTAIKATDCGCPVCRVPIQQVIKIYVV